jgi:hypothetical protein
MLRKCAQSIFRLEITLKSIFFRRQSEIFFLDFSRIGYINVMLPLNINNNIKNRICVKLKSILGPLYMLLMYTFLQFELCQVLALHLLNDISSIYLENWTIFVFIDCYDHFAVFHTRNMLNSTTNANCYIQFLK